MSSDSVLKAFEEVQVSEQNLDQVLGITEIDENMLGMVSGAHDGPEGHGLFYTISGECNGGRSCNPFSW